MPEISVVIPLYNKEGYLPRCLDSIIGQTFSDLEVLCVDDASTDASLSIARRYERLDDRIRVICLDQNHGSGPARNRGIEEARGKYLTFCDADDAYTPNALKMLHAAMSHSGAPVSGGNIVFMDNTLSRIVAVGDVVACTQFWERATVSPRAFPPLWMPTYHPRFMIALDFLKAHSIRYPALLRGQDPPFLAHALCHAEQVAVCPEVVYLCRGSRPGEKKIRSQRAFQDYVAHFGETFDVFMKHGARKQALFFLAQALTVVLSTRELRGLAGKDRQQLLAGLLPLASTAGEALYQEDYAPYRINTASLKRDVRLVQKGLFPLLLWKAVHKIIHLFC